MAQVQKKQKPLSEQKQGSISEMTDLTLGSEQVGTRTVRLVYKKQCNCQMNSFTVDREVPKDSPLKDGDAATAIYRSDKAQGVGEVCPAMAVQMALFGTLGD